jgi:hypothetical protein
VLEGAPGRIVLATIALLTTGMCLAAPVQDCDWGVVVAPRPGTTVAAGSTVEIRWGTLPDGVTELELLLSVDQTGESWVRLTEQLLPDTGSYLWEVPDLPAGHARLKLRVGLPGDVELDGPVGGMFEIAPAGGGRIVPLGWREGEWWTAALALPASPLGRCQHGVTGVPQILAARDYLANGRHTRPPLLSPPETTGIVWTVASNDSGSDLLHSDDNRPRSAPLRC